MGVAQSHELCQKWKTTPSDIFITTNKKELLALLKLIQLVVAAAKTHGIQPYPITAILPALSEIVGMDRNISCGESNDSSYLCEEEDVSKIDSTECGNQQTGSNKKEFLNRNDGPIGSEAMIGKFEKNQETAIFDPSDESDPLKERRSSNSSCIKKELFKNDRYHANESPIKSYPSSKIADEDTQENKSISDELNKDEKKKKKKEKTVLSNRETLRLLNELSTINVANHYIGDAGILSSKYRALECLYLISPHLSALDLSYNALTPISLIPMVRTLMEVPSSGCLTSLTLSGSTLGKEFCDVLGEFISMPKGRGGHALQFLSLFQCQLRDEDVADLIDKSFRHHTHLRKIILSYNYCTDVTVMRFIDILGGGDTDASGCNTSLTEVEVDYNAPKNQYIPAIERACTSEGIFPSGRTYCYDDGTSQDPKEDSATKESSSENPNKSNNKYIARNAEDSTIRRFGLRRNFLGLDMAGRSPFSPHLLQRLAELLRENSNRAAAEGEESEAAEFAAGTTSSGHEGMDRQLNAEEDASARRVDIANGEEEEAHAMDVNQDLDDAEQDEFADQQETMRSDRKKRYLAHTGRFSSLPAIGTRARVRHDIEEAYRWRRKLGNRGKDNYDKILPNGFDCVRLGPELSTPVISVRHTDDQTHPSNRANGSLLNSTDKGSRIHKNDYVYFIPPRTLQPCWCDPREAAAAYGGMLHYHCKSEEHIDYTSHAAKKSSKNTTGKDGSAKQNDKGATGKKKAGSSSTSRKEGKSPGKVRGNAAPSFLCLEDPKAFQDEPIDFEQINELRRKGYHGCQGTGHRCVSYNLSNPPGSYTINPNNSTQKHSSPPIQFSHQRLVESDTLAAVRSKGSARSNASTPAYLTPKPTALGAVGGGGNFTQAVIRATNGDEYTWKLGYHPVAFFTAPHRSVARGIIGGTG